MKKILTCLLAVLGLTTACGQGNSEKKEAGKAVTTDAYEVDVFQTKSGKTVTFHALMHSCIRIEFDGKEIEIDPVAKLGNRTINYSNMPKADFLLVTHEHGDHYDAATIKLLSKESTQLIMNKRCAEMYGAGKVMTNGQTDVFDGIKVEAVPAYNNVSSTKYKSLKIW